MGFWRCCVYYAILGVVSFPVGRLLRRFLRADRFPFRVQPWESRLYRALRVHDWQAKAPDMSRLLPALIPPKRLTADYRAYLPRMIEETCVAELVHALLSLAGIYTLRIWPGRGGRILTALYILVGNLPFIVIQRYNRPRLQRLLAHQRRRGNNTERSSV